MHLITLLSGIMAVSGLAINHDRGFTVPPGTVDGFYHAYYDDSGNQVHERVNGPVPDDELSARDFSPIQSRAIDNAQYWCGCNSRMNNANCDAAVADLKAQAARAQSAGTNSIPPGNSFYSIRGSVVAFACSKHVLPTTLTASDATSAFPQITGKCGLYVPGTVTNFRSAVFPHYGYMNWQSGLDFCATSTGSSKSSCP